MVSLTTSYQDDSNNNNDKGLSRLQILNNLNKLIISLCLEQLIVTMIVIFKICLLRLENLNIETKHYHIIMYWPTSCHNDNNSTNFVQTRKSQQPKK